VQWLSGQGAGATIHHVVIEERTQIAAPVPGVWAIVADPDRIAALSPEVHHIEWTGEPGPRTGATFRGHNRAGPLRWTTTNTIEVTEPNSVFGWRTSEGNNLCVSRWTYRLEETPDGCQVIERYQPVGWMATTECLLGRAWMLRRGMRATLRRLKTAAENETTG
jgi:hypothetical protein